jgi:glutaredoxin
MEKPQKVVAGFFTLAFAVIVILLLFYLNKPINPPISNVTSNETITIYYGNTCPHCKIVEEWINENNINSILNITQKEVFANVSNQPEIMDVFKICKIPANNQGVPLLYAEGNCYMGDEDVISFLKNKAGIK